MLPFKFELFHQSARPFLGIKWKTVIFPSFDHTRSATRDVLVTGSALQQMDKNKKAQAAIEKLMLQPRGEKAD